MTATPRGENFNTARKQQIVYLDNLKLFLIVLVVAYHAGRAYTGGHWLVQTPTHVRWLSAYLFVNATFFMGLFFFISGLFTVNSLARKGVKQYCIERLKRFSLPIVVFGYASMCLLRYYFPHQKSGGFITYLFAHPNPHGTAQVWFLISLLAYSLFFALLFMKFSKRFLKIYRLPNPWKVAIFVLFFAGSTYLIRIFYPQDDWLDFYWVINLEPAHFPQYILMFFAGCFAGRSQWLNKLSSKVGYVWLSVAVLLSLFLVWSFLSRHISLPPGGPSWRQGVRSVMDALMCVGYTIGLSVLFRDHLNRTNAFIKVLTDNAFGIYLVHFVIVIVLQYELLSSTLSPTDQFFIVFCCASLLSFSVSYALRKVPVVKRIMGEV